jgi:hypothetical protein
MAMAVISVNTETQECALTLDGALVNADDIYFSKYTDHNGDLQKAFSYSVQMMEPDGMMKKMMHTMVPKDSPEYSNENAGLVSKEIKTKNKLYKEVEDFVTKNIN